MTIKTLRRPRWVAGRVLLCLLGFIPGSMIVFIGGWAIVDAVTGDAERILDGGVGFAALTVGYFALGVAGVTGMAVRALGGTDDLAGPLGILLASLVTGVVLSGWIASGERAGPWKGELETQGVDVRPSG